jgi:hypothetical protein
MFFNKRTNGTNGGWAAVANGLDGCLLLAVVGLVSAPAGVCGMFLWATWDGWKQAFTPQFTQSLILTALVIIGAAVIFLPTCWLIAIYYQAKRPETVIEPAPATYIVTANGAARPISEQTPPALPPATPQHPVRLAGNQIARQWIGKDASGSKSNGASQGKQGIGWKS